MALVNKGLLLSVLLVLSLAHLALAHWSWKSEEDNGYHNLKKPKVYGGKSLHKRKYGGLYKYGGKPSNADIDSEEVEKDNDGGYHKYDKKVKKPAKYYKKPYKSYPFSKSYYKYKPIKPDSKPAKPFQYSPNRYYKPKPKPSNYKPQPSYYDNPKPKTSYKPKPYYTQPKPTYAKPAIYSKPAINYQKPLPEIEEPAAPVYMNKPLPEPKKPYSYYRNPMPEYEPPQEPEVAPAAPEKPAYTSPASSSEREWLEPHNAARAEVGLPPMVWSDEVAQFAQSWANQRLASGCGLEHSGGAYGENIFWGSGGAYGPAECVGAWVNEKQYYNYGDNSCAGGQQCGHYTQIIWANSIHLGCARVQCDSGDVFMTCNYDPPGNYIGTKPY